MRWWVVLLVLIACSQAPRGPYFGDERFLVVGTDPKREAEALVTQLRAQGYEVRVRMSGREFTAIDFLDAQGRAGPLRIVTARGIVLALDSGPQSVLDPAGMEFRLLAPPLRRSHDVDSDGHEEIFVEERDLALGTACIRTHRVMPDGSLREVRGLDPLQRPECDSSEGPDGGIPQADGGVNSNLEG